MSELHKGFKEAKINFDERVEIKYLKQVSKPNCVQIIAKNCTEGLLFIMTWDFEQNIEVSMY